MLRRRKLAPPDPARHFRKCFVCRHSQRALIEAEFMRWRSPERLVPRYRIPHASMLYRHLHAVGLFDERNGSFARKFDSLLKRSHRGNASMVSLLKASQPSRDAGTGSRSNVAGQHIYGPGLTGNLIENSTIRIFRNSLKTKPHENS